MSDVDLIATAGAADANAFADLAFALEYLAARSNAGAFNTAEENDQLVALIDGARELSALEAQLQGYRTTATQALCWPRTLVINTKAPFMAPIGLTGYPQFADDIVPVDWMKANCEFALEILRAGASDITALDPTIGVIRDKTDVLETEYAKPYERAQGLSRFPRIRDLVSQFFGASGGGGLDVVRC